MFRTLSIRSPGQLTSSAVSILIVSGGVILITLVHEWAILSLSAIALLFQGVAVLLALISRLWQRSHRFLTYPLILFSTIYLWDTNLPPPSLPDGALRALIPLLVIATLFFDVGIAGWRMSKKQPSTNGVNVVGGYADLDEAARFFGITSTELRVYLREQGKPAIVSLNGHEQIGIFDLIEVLSHYHSSKDTLIVQ